MNIDSPCLISVAPNGARKTKSDHPAIPLSIEEIAHEAAICRDAGAALLHLHIRANDARHLLDAQTYRAATKAVKKAIGIGDDMVIQITSEAGGIYEQPQQIAVVRETHPEAVSLALREMIRGESDKASAEDFFHWLSNEGILAQYILYGPGEVKQFSGLKKQGLIPDTNLSVLFVLGSYGGVESNPDEIQNYLDCLDDNSLSSLSSLSWAVCGFGKTEALVAERAVKLGGHPRVGFENNIYTQDGLVAENNSVLVAQVAEYITKSERNLANTAHARKLLAGKI